MEDNLHIKHMGLRKKGHQRNIQLDDLLKELEELFGPVEKDLMKRFTAPQRPVLLLVGNPRSGSTVFMQFLQETGSFAMFTNVLSRFYYAPFIGAKIQQLLFNPAFDFRGELTSPVAEGGTTSSLGKTRGPLSPSEALHFFRRFVPHYDPQYLEPERRDEVDAAGMAAELAAIESVFDRPLAMKNVLLLYNLNCMRKCTGSSLVLYLKRDPIFIAQSLLLARENHYGRRDIWWSVKPKEYDQLKDMDVFHQVAGQVFFTKKAVEDALVQVPKEEQLTIEYESFCEAPESIYQKIVERYAELGCELPSGYIGEARFNCSREIRLSSVDFDALTLAYNAFESGAVRIGW